MKWGLIPHWAKDPKIGYKMINARVETIGMKPSFKNSFKNKRCIIPADGFYEWWKPSFTKAKVPYFVGLKDHQLFSLAGLYDEWEDDSGKNIRSFTIITVPANKLISAIHDRMPVILKKEDESDWLDVGINDQKKLIRMLKPYNSKEMESYQVSSFVNKTDVDRKELIEPIRILDSKDFKKKLLSSKHKP
jgi:putative SOS response-associated peptidase YedK